MSFLVLGAVLAQQTNAFAQFLPLILIVAVFYLLLIRPQQRKARQHQELVQSTNVGDRVVTIGGIHGTVQTIDEDTVQLEVSRGTTITMARTAIARRLVDADTAVNPGSIDITDQTGDTGPGTP
jgi:preprotein translocase subunit YajC